MFNRHLKAILERGTWQIVPIKRRRLAHGARLASFGGAIAPPHEDTIARAVQHIPFEPQPAPKSCKRCKVDSQLLHYADRAPARLLVALHASRSASIHCSLAARPRPTCRAVTSSLAFNTSLSGSAPTFL